MSPLSVSSFSNFKYNYQHLDCTIYLFHIDNPENAILLSLMYNLHRADFPKK